MSTDFPVMRMASDMDEITHEFYANYRPFLHYSPPKGWMNDPNGLIYYEGFYHLFYQHYPDGVKHGPMHWGHAKSTDLVHWETLPIALSPDDNGVIYSGSIVADTRNTAGFSHNGETMLVAVFTHHKKAGDLYTESQSLAASCDGGLHFTKFSANPVLRYHEPDFRDPKVFWHDASQKWIMLVVNRRSVMFYNSNDLSEWLYLSSFTSQNTEPDGIWECPDLFCIGVEDTDMQKWVLMVSVNSTDHRYYGMQYFVGEFDGTKYVAETPDEIILMADFGIDNYAMVTFAGIENRIVGIGWMNCWYYASRIPEAGFRGSMTLPREFSLRKSSKGFQLLQRPIRELWGENLIDISRFCGQRTISLPVGAAIVTMQLEDKNNEISICSSSGMLSLTIDSKNHTITVKRNFQSFGELISDYEKTMTAEYSETCSEIKLLFVIDTTSIEIFVNDGELTGTFLCFTRYGFSHIDIQDMAKECVVYKRAQ